jgi:phosphate transport system substrate-binding protein
MGAMGMSRAGDRTRERRQRGWGTALAALRLALPLIAGVAWWLAAMPASGQHKAPEIGSAVSRSGEGAPWPRADLAGRKQLLIVGATSLQGITDAVIKHLAGVYVLPQPITQFEGTRVGIAAFCAGIGPEYPDIVAAADRMSRGEFETCVENKVLDVIEVAIGDSAVVVVTKKGDQLLNLTPRMAYYGLAEKIPNKGEFRVNQNKTWKETDKDAPELPIQVFIPAIGSGTRSFFDDRFMQGGCRHVKEIDAIFAVADRVPLCITLRDDGPVRQVPEEEIVDALVKAPRGALAVIAWTVYLKNRDKLDVLPIDGILPSHVNIDDDSYAMTARLRYYFKRAHMMEKSGGRGVVEGIGEFMDEIVKDEAFGEGGYLEAVGMVALDDGERQTEKKIVRRLKRFQP